MMKNYISPAMNIIELDPDEAARCAAEGTSQFDENPTLPPITGEGEDIF